MIDSYHRRPWPDKVLEALGRFKQGDVMEKPAFFYAIATGGRIWGPDEEDEEEPDDPDDRSQVAEWHAEDSPQFGIITTQTCDILEQGEPAQPWVQISPVYRLEEDDSAENQERLLSKAYIVELNGPDLPDGRWVADLRIELPVEKSVLAGMKPIAGFATEDEADDFGRRLGVRRARPALADELVRNVTRLIGRRKTNNKPRSAAVWAELYKLGLQIEEGTRFKPLAVRLHVITAEEPSELVREWFAAWEDAARAKAQAVGITLHTTRHHDARSMDVILADRLIDLDIP